MTQPRKMIFRFSVGLILFFIFVPLIGRFFPLKFASQNEENWYEGVRFFAVPLAILLTLSGTLKDHENKTATFLKLVWTIIVAGLSVFVLFMALFTDMCAWTTDKVLFENKNERSVQIVLRGYGCGATDSGSPIYEICKVRNIIPGFIWVTEADTTKIDRTVWVQLKE